MSDIVTLALMDKLKRKVEETSKQVGPQGECGPAGPAGKDGKDGRDGVDGKPGRDGADGKDGKDGKDGEDGEAGVGVAQAEVTFDNHLVLTLTDGNEIDCGEIKVDSEDNITINKVMGGGGGGFTNGYLDMDGKGIIARFTASEALATGDVCRLDSSGQMAKADALAEPLCNNMMAMALDDLGTGELGRFQLSGYADIDGFTPGDILFVDIGGGFTATRPTLSGTIVRVLGYAISPTTIFFNPDTTWIEVN